MVAASIRVIPWRNDFREFFALAGKDWAPPTEIQSSVSAGGQRLRMVADFTKPDGQQIRFTTVIRRRADGEWDYVEERIEARFIIRGGEGVAR